MICGAELRKGAGELSLSEIQIRIAGIDWSFVAKKLSLQGFSPEDTEKIMLQYHRYLVLFGVVGEDVSLVPWGRLDKAWHEHILCTSKYKKDCNHLFDCFLHHNPEIEMGSEENIKNTEKTRLVYEKYFHEQMPEYVE